jgi:hypothetical protein
MVNAMTGTPRSDHLSLFVAERYVSRAQSQDCHAHDSQRAQTASQNLAARGIAVRYLGSILVPDDETCFTFLEAHSVDEVRQLADQASITYQRILPAQRLDTCKHRTGRTGRRNKKKNR